MLWGLVGVQSHARSACASASTARGAPGSHQSSARILGARRTKNVKMQLTQNKRLFAPKDRMRVTHRTRARPSPHNTCYLRQATTPTSRRWRGVQRSHYPCVSRYFQRRWVPPPQPMPPVHPRCLRRSRRRSGGELRHRLSSEAPSAPDG